MEDTRTPEETNAKRKQLEQKRANHRFKNRLLKFTIIASGLLSSSTSANAQGFHFERVNRTQAQAPRQVQYGTPEWAESQGYRYSPKYSQCLNHRGMINMENGTLDHQGYLGAWIKPTNDPRVQKVIFLPNNPVEDAHLVEEQYSTVAKDMMKLRDGPYQRSNRLPRGWGLIR